MSRAQYSIKFKLMVVNEYNKLKSRHGVVTGIGEKTVKLLANKYDISASSICRWVRDERDGLLNADNVVAVSRKPEALVSGDIYHLAGRDFKSKEEAIRYAVELAGGLTVSKLTTVAVEV